MARTVKVFDKMQRGYRYALTAGVGRAFHPDFKPGLTPKQMLELGVFGGRYLNDCRKEFPISWFAKAKLSETHDRKLNYFKTDASQSLAVWQAKGWIRPQDPRGWFQWYCRYYMGRRSEDDLRQIRRWIGIRRHALAVARNCARRDLGCRPRQRQALLHWAIDSRKI